ncbi:corticotropin-releasing factor-binding protein-like [Octopus vulgaris]|uniref:Corticotropin-releasing factor-binding protein n=1 Tax=Octopus vulgaris TaxID=6645 RepID=A0AA36B5R2_OCTVU|nr:corticotropin-releasing factor-binding protein-like [Octopus vulgaris]
MWKFFIVTFILQVGLGTVLSVKRHAIFRRQAGLLAGKIDCNQLKTSPGDYWYIADEFAPPCAFYLIGGHDKIVELEFLDFNIDCEEGGELSIIDGWELNNQFFPSPNDLPRNLHDERYCGINRPRRKFIASQNAALINFYVPIKGQGFTLRVKFIKNSLPCNVISITHSGTYTLKNYGIKMNCSFSFIFPSIIKTVAVNVGITSTMNFINIPQRRESLQSFFRKQLTPSLKYNSQCMKRGGSDYFQLKTGDGLDPRFMQYTSTSICGTSRYNRYNPGVLLGCGHSVVRMVSSGNYYNSVTFTYQEASEKELETQKYDFC